MSKIADAVIAGAGPAGVATALRLLAAGKRVVVLERGPAKPVKLPETYLPFDGLSPQLSGLVRTAAQESAMPFDVCFLGRKVRHQLRMEFVPDEDSSSQLRRVDRARFDSYLRQALIEAGAEIEYLRTVTAVNTEVDVVTVTHAGPAGDRETCQARILVDATGKMAVLKNILKFEAPSTVLDMRAGLFTHYIVDSSCRTALPATVNIIPLDAGFVYAIWLEETRISIGATLFDSGLTAGEEEFRRALAEVPWLQRTIADAKQVLPVIPVQNRAYQIRELAGAQYVIAGDAGGFTDPFFSNGIRVALETGELAGDTALQLLTVRDGNWWPVAEAHAQRYREIVAAANRSMATAVAASALPLHTFHLTDPHVPYPLSAALTGLVNMTPEAPVERMGAIRSRGGAACASTISA
jgi:flavin-dependent dehydrogenase